MDRADKELNKAHYDENAADDRVRAHAEANRLHSLELVVPWVVSSLGPGARLIDIAGGSGAHASQIVRAGSRSISVVGVDISETMIRQRTEDPLLSENVVADMETLPFDAESFDGAMFVAALHHVPDPLLALREAWRVVRPGGQLFVYEPNSLRAGADDPEPLPEHPKEFRVGVAYLTERIRAAGFDVDDVQTKRISLRLVELFTESAPLTVYHAGDRVDGLLRLVPRLRLLGTMAMVHATKRPKVSSARS
jgi:SAM-dependent methyltransferase